MTRNVPSDRSFEPLAPPLGIEVRLLVDDGLAQLWVEPQHSDPMQSALRQLPLVGRLIPAMVVPPLTASVFRLRLLPQSSKTCYPNPCPDALLLSATSGPIGEMIHNSRDNIGSPTGVKRLPQGIR